MIKKIIFGGFVLLIACSDEQVSEAPKNLLKKPDLISVLIDLHILESHFQREYSRPDMYRDALDSSSVSIFKSHNTTKANFEESLDYYALNPESLHSIYEAALDSINYRMSRTH
jgi:hypothetical protein